MKIRQGEFVEYHTLANSASEIFQQILSNFNT